MDTLDTREWLITNGLGSFASGTVSDARTRTYHGWLIAALDPPSQRTLLLSHLETNLEVGGQGWALGTNFWQSGTIAPLGYQRLQSFDFYPCPTWVWSEGDWQLTRQILMPYGLESGDEISAQFCNRVLIQYRYQGREAAILRLRPLIGDRNFHHQQLATPDLSFSQLVGEQQVCFQAIHPSWTGTPWYLRWTAGDYQPEGVWYWGYHYPEEALRGLGDREDLYSPGYLTVTLQPGDILTLEARVGWPDPTPGTLSHADFEQALLAEEPIPDQSHEREILWRQLLRAADQFIVYRASINGPTVIAGYPWFNDWGRDTLIALPGLALTLGRFSVAKGLLQTFGSYCQWGLIPNAFPDAGSDPFYNSIDAALLWIETLGLYLEATQDWEFLAEQYRVVRQIYKAFCAGTLYNIHTDAKDGLLVWDAPGVALTWMDVAIAGETVTPRRGKPVEINALWYSALCWATQWAERLAQQNRDQQEKLTNQARRYAQQAEQVKASLKQFWNPEPGYFYDTLEPNGHPNPQIRPNAVIALSLHHCGFPDEQAQQVLQVARDRLLTPYGLRSLDSADPAYIGTYGGDPVQRDSAYHQGTVWSWLIGPFVRAWERFNPDSPLPFDWQPLVKHFQQEACLGSVSEIFDGDPPHGPKGAFAQAWSVAELIRHLPKQ